MTSDPEFTAKVPFTQDPEFIKLERALQLRQEQETKKLLDQQTQQRIEYGRSQGVTREMLDANYNRQLKDREALVKNHKAEHDRYIREYHDAKALTAGLTEDEKKRALEDSPKRSR